MNPILQCLLITISLIVLLLAILQPQTRKTKEPFVAELQQGSIGISVGVGLILLFLGLFFVYSSIPKEPNVIPRRSTYYNLE